VDSFLCQLVWASVLQIIVIIVIITIFGFFHWTTHSFGQMFWNAVLAERL
jgi:hypothetical protein